ncbi:CopL family metal-binding regulatory protein [Stenotrophomonas oahuensis]|uniref:CopL family metal-binding regulatory protein n=1 Tax=Stenotrophomonas oahuensis TaxID=3003271 RepID=A0ABY9YQF9_9GAMM|nr:CopL family metal-binding regulatory protein [Stenotrophomonas sp. A5586]WNH53142.1 CopL family metal-binding regulatory protein [Stenotrophomonas sp. A5586]
MSPGGLLLRVVLMLSLLFNGLNIGMAAPMALALLPTVATAPGAPPCHSEAATAHGGHDAVPAQAHTPGHDAQKPHDGDQCRLKDCLRNCAQQPSLTAQVLWLPTPMPLAQAPLRESGAALPPPPLDRITRPPIA